MGSFEALGNLGSFHYIEPPDGNDEFQFAAQLVKWLTYVMLVGTFLSPVGIVYGALMNNAFVLMASLAAIPSFLLLALSYPAFVAGEQWSLLGILLVAVGLGVLAPLRFFTEAASLGPYLPAPPPTPWEIALFAAAFVLMYVLLLPETRDGMRRARETPSIFEVQETVTPTPPAPSKFVTEDLDDPDFDLSGRKRPLGVTIIALLSVPWGLLTMAAATVPFVSDLFPGARLYFVLVGAGHVALAVGLWRLRYWAWAGTMLLTLMTIVVAVVQVSLGALLLGVLVVYLAGTREAFLKPSPNRARRAPSPYVCPSCAKVYKLRTMPPTGTPCPECRTHT